MIRINQVKMVQIRCSKNLPNQNKTRTRMHSSRMRTVRCSDRRGWGVCPEGGVCQEVCIPACTEADTPPPWTEFLTHVCENITFPQLCCGRQKWHFPDQLTRCRLSVLRGIKPTKADCKLCHWTTTFICEYQSKWHRSMWLTLSKVLKASFFFYLNTCFIL